MKPPNSHVVLMGKDKGGAGMTKENSERRNVTERRNSERRNNPTADYAGEERRVEERWSAFDRRLSR